MLSVSRLWLLPEAEFTHASTSQMGSNEEAGTLALSRDVCVCVFTRSEGDG